MAEALRNSITSVGIDIGKNSFHVVGLDGRGVIVLRQKWSRGQVEARFANMPPCLVGMEACNGAHHLSRKLRALGHDARLMPAAASHWRTAEQKVHELGPRKTKRGIKISRRGIKSGPPCRMKQPGNSHHGAFV